MGRQLGYDLQFWEGEKIQVHIGKVIGEHVAMGGVHLFKVKYMVAWDYSFRSHRRGSQQPSEMNKIETLCPPHPLKLTKVRTLGFNFQTSVYRRGSHNMVTMEISAIWTANLNDYRKRRSASYIVREVRSVREREREREREIQRERDGSDVTTVALKLAMSLHFPLPNIRTWLWVYTFPCQKFALFVSPFTLPISPFLCCGAEICNEFSLSIAKKFRPLCSAFLKWRDCTSHRKNESN